MALFIGNWDEFRDYLNDYTKNKVPALTKKYKGGACEFCGTEIATDAAHLHGRERPVLMREAFDAATISRQGERHGVDLKVFAAEIKKRHSDPANFKFLCHACHRSYDAKLKHPGHKPVSKTTLTGDKNMEINVPDKSVISFEKYLELRGYARGTIIMYAKSMPAYLKNHNRLDIFSLKTSHDVWNLLNKLNTDSSFLQAEITGRKKNSNAMKRYAEYLDWRSK
ncbi:MAG: hypothetical protein IJ479_04445 [Alphaproteobacteria bacterium]|nr:hypothetical protein [Alphaproteobacteria bacterium]